MFSQNWPGWNDDIRLTLVRELCFCFFACLLVLWSIVFLMSCHCIILSSICLHKDVCIMWIWQQRFDPHCFKYGYGLYCSCGKEILNVFACAHIIFFLCKWFKNFNNKIDRNVYSFFCFLSHWVSWIKLFRIVSHWLLYKHFLHATTFIS